MSIDVYFTNRSLATCAHALCRDLRRDVLAIHRWVERPEGGRQDERIARLRAGAAQPAIVGFSGAWPALPGEQHYASRLCAAEYDADGQLVAEHNPPRFLGFVSRLEFETAAHQSRDNELATAWTEMQALPAPPGTRFASRADAHCQDCLVKDLAWSHCSPRVCTAAGMPYLAAGLAIAVDRGLQTDQAAGATTRYREVIGELFSYYEIQPHRPTPRLDRVRAQRVRAEKLEEGADAERWPDEHPTANALLEALMLREAPITAEEATFLLARLFALTHLLSQTVEEQDGQVKRLAYKALTMLGTYTRCLRIALRFGLEMVLVAA